MMKKIIGIFVLIAITLPCAYGNGGEGFMTGKQLLKLCESQKAFERSMCFGYIRGMTEAELANETLCLDPGITFRRTMNKSIELMNSEPQFLNESAVLTLVEQLKEVHPCEHSEH